MGDRVLLIAAVEQAVFDAGWPAEMVTASGARRMIDGWRASPRWPFPHGWFSAVSAGDLPAGVHAATIPPRRRPESCVLRVARGGCPGWVLLHETAHLGAITRDGHRGHSRPWLAAYADVVEAFAPEHADRFVTAVTAAGLHREPA